MQRSAEVVQLRIRAYDRPMEYSLGERGQAVYAVSEYGPGVVFATWGDRGTPAHLVGEYGGGAQAVLFENGPPPGSVPVGPPPLYLAPPPRDWTPENLLLLLH